MIKRQGLKRFLVGLAFVVLFATGYVTTSAVTSCQAEAQVCCNTPCIAIATGTGPAIAALDGVLIAPGILWAIASVGIYYVSDLLQFALKVFEEIGVVISDWVDWWDTFWYYDLNPALQDMGRELTVMDAAQARALGGFKDMMALNRALIARSEFSIDAHMSQRPAENVCVAGSLSGGMNQARVVAAAYGSAAAYEKLNRGTNAKGTVAAAGAAADMGARYKNYCSRYSDPRDNAGMTNCPAAGAFPGADLDVPGEIFQKQTIDLKSGDTKKTVDDIIDNIAEPFVRNPLPADTYSDAKGQQNVLEQERMRAQRQAIYGALYHVVARRAPGSGLDAQVSEIHQAAGVTPETTASPSKNEVMNALAIEKTQTGDFSVRQIDEPENNAREATIQAGIRTRQLADMLDLVDRYSLIVAGQVGNEIAAERPTNDRVGAQSMH